MILVWVIWWVIWSLRQPEGFTAGLAGHCLKQMTCKIKKETCLTASEGNCILLCTSAVQKEESTYEAASHTDNN